MAQSPNHDSVLAYGFKNGYLVISTSEILFQEILSLKPENSLAQQASFRNFVLYGKNSADRYGIIDTKKILQWLNLQESITGKSTIGNKILNFFANYKKPFFFQRKADEKSLIWEFEQ